MFTACMCLSVLYQCDYVCVCLSSVFRVLVPSDVLFEIHIGEHEHVGCERNIHRYFGVNRTMFCITCTLKLHMAAAIDVSRITQSSQFFN